ncbi:MAG: acetate/propionate family kinase [Candidatus Methylacidiphilales bacterium]
MPAQGTILVANIGSTSFKFRLYAMPDERLLARGGVERIGASECPWQFAPGDQALQKGSGSFPDYAAAIRWAGSRLEQDVGFSFASVNAIGFKPVMAKGISGTQTLDEPVLRAMEDLATLLPAHNPPYVQAVRTFRQLHPAIPCIGTFETAFFDHLDPEQFRYPVPLAWERDFGIRRYGFHGASHRFVSERAAQLDPSARKVITCHLGGSSSLAAILDGRAIDSSWGMTPQSGLPQNNRVGDFDPFALIYLARDCGLGLDTVEKILARDSGLRGMAGTDSGDLRDVKAAAAAGSEDARVALAVFVNAIRGYLGRFLVALGGLDLLVFTAGIGENNPDLRAAICRNLDFIGLKLDSAANDAAVGKEALISTPDSKVGVRVIPTCEEIIIARNAWAHLHLNN